LGAVPDPISSTAEALADDALPGAGVVVAGAGFFGGLAATDTSIPGFETERRPDCDPLDFDCYTTTVTDPPPVSILGAWVPEWWVTLGGVPAGVLASVITCACVLLLVFWARVQAARTRGTDILR
jgi:hypothetical protein